MNGPEKVSSYFLSKWKRQERVFKTKKCKNSNFKKIRINKTQGSENSFIYWKSIAGRLDYKTASWEVWTRVCLP